MSKKPTSGDGATFNENWQNRSEALRLHFSKSTPATQLELAFRKHFEYINVVANVTGPLKVLEVGAGRGSLGAHFAEAGHDVTLLDISERAIELAKSAYESYGLRASYLVANCEDIPLPSESYDLVCSIGLLEHFVDPSVTIREQFRVLKKGGNLCSYVVPEHSCEIQQQHDWINNMLASMRLSSEFWEEESSAQPKQPTFRTNYLHDYYRQAYKDAGFTDINHNWVYRMPMISHSPKFPFSLLPPAAEEVLVQHLQSFQTDGIAGWSCRDLEGQAFFVNGSRS